MAEFNVIETQEQLDAIIGERLKRDREAQAKKYEGFISSEDVQKIREEYDKQISDLNGQITAAAEKYNDFDKQLADRDNTIKQYEMASVKTKVAGEYGLSVKAMEFIKGDTEEDMRQSAENLKSLIGVQTAPLKSNEPAVSTNKEMNGLRSMLNNLNFGG